MIIIFVIMIVTTINDDISYVNRNRNSNRNSISNRNSNRNRSKSVRWYLSA